MAQQFLNELPKVRNEDLADGAICMICREEYGTIASDNGVIEHAVLLPCLHQVGSECIARWLSPKDGPGNSCPMCRRFFFPAYNEDYDDEEDDEGGDDFVIHESENHPLDTDDDDDELPPLEPEPVLTDDSEGIPLTLLEAFERLASTSVETPTSEEPEGQDSPAWFERWPLPTTQQVNDSLQRARQELLKPPPRLFGQFNTPPTPTPPPDLEQRATTLASAYRTTAFRETLLYLDFNAAGARIPPLEFPHRGLSVYQEEMLLWEMGQRGAFRGTNAYQGLTNRQMWARRRGKGEVFVYQCYFAGGRDGYWSTDLGGEQYVEW